MLTALTSTNDSPEGGDTVLVNPECVASVAPSRRNEGTVIYMRNGYRYSVTEPFPVVAKKLLTKEDSR